MAMLRLRAWLSRSVARLVLIVTFGHVTMDQSVASGPDDASVKPPLVSPHHR